MIDGEMIDHSRKHLHEFFTNLKQKEKENIGLMGGWAVHLLLKRFEVDHIGSRDIDIFFNPEKIQFQRVKELINARGFIPHSTFRWARYIQRSAGKEISREDSKDVPLFDLICIYLDVAAPKHVDKTVMVQEKLSEVFVGEMEWCKLDDLRVMTPSPKILVETKLESSLERVDRFKRTKDVADIFALLRSFNNLWEMDKGERIGLKSIDSKLKEKFKARIDEFEREGTIKDAASMLDIPVSVIIETLRIM